MEQTDWLNVMVGGLAIAILVGGFLMMFTGIWTQKSKKP